MVIFICGASSELAAYVIRCPYLLLYMMVGRGMNENQDISAKYEELYIYDWRDLVCWLQCQGLNLCGLCFDGLFGLASCEIYVMSCGIYIHFWWLFLLKWLFNFQLIWKSNIHGSSCAYLCKFFIMLLFFLKGVCFLWAYTCIVLVFNLI